MNTREEALRAIRIYLHTSRHLMEALTKDMEREGLNPTEFRVLEMLHAKQAMSLQTIAKTINITSGSMTYVSHRLQQKGWITTMRGSDQRVTMVTLTPKGQATIAKVFTPHAAFIEELMSVLSLEELQEWIRISKKLGQSIQKRNEAALVSQAS